MKGTIVSRIDMLARMNKKYEYRFCDEFGIKLAYSRALGKRRGSNILCGNSLYRLFEWKIKCGKLKESNFITLIVPYGGEVWSP